MWQKIFPKLPLGASEVVFKVIESSPARDDCLLFGWILVIKCVLDRKHFITNAKRGDYVYNLLIACLANTGKQWEPAIQCLPNLETQQRATLFSSVKALAKKHPPSIIHLYSCLCMASSDFYDHNCSCPLFTENLWWISQRDGTNVFKGTDAPGALWAILRLCSAVFKTCIRESSNTKYFNWRGDKRTDLTSEFPRNTF